jgi:hypothetical protein
MTPFEKELKNALVRREPSDAFTARVMAAVSELNRAERAAPLGFLARLRSWRLIPVLAGALVISGGIVYQQHEREARGEAAKKQLILAMRIAGSKLHYAQLRVEGVEQ